MMTKQTDIEKIKNMAGFKFPEITKGLEELKAQQVIANTELRKIVKSKNEQKISDNEKHAVWKKQKDQSTILSLVAIFIAGLAFADSRNVDVFGVATEYINLIKDLL